MVKRVWIASVLCVALVMGQAADTYANISEAAVLFLRIAAGARPAGMGEAFVAIADDATATHWNPAGLGRYPLSDLWLATDLPAGRRLADFAVVENDVPEMNYARYDMWVVTRAESGYYQTAPFADPAVKPLEVTPGTFNLVVDGVVSNPIALPTGVYTDGNQLAAAFAAEVHKDANIPAEGVTVDFVRDGDKGALRFVSANTGAASSVLFSQAAADTSGFLSGGRSIAGLDAQLMRSTPPGPHNLSGSSSARWEKGDTYSPDASEDLPTLVRLRTGLPEGPELDERVRMVAELNQRMSTDSLRTWWNGIKELPGAVISDSLLIAFDNLLAANDRLNTDPNGVQDVLDEMADIVRDGQLDEDELFRLKVLIQQRAITTYLPEKIEFPFSFNLTGDVTALASHKRTLWIGTTRGLLRKSEDRWVAMNDSAAGPAAGVIHDIQIAPSGAVWVATDQGVSRYTSGWKHFSMDDGWVGGRCDRVFVLGEDDVYATAGLNLYRWDPQTRIWQTGFSYKSSIGDDLRQLPAKLLDIRDSIQARGFTDSLVLYSGLAPETLEAGTVINIPFRLALRGAVTAMARSTDQTLWIGTRAGLVSLSPTGHVRRYGYSYEKIAEPMTVVQLAEQFVGTEHPERAQRLAQRIKADNGLKSDSLAPGRTIAVYNSVRGATIHSLFADGGTLLVGTEFGMVEYSGGSNWYRYLHQDLEDSRALVIAERSGERWFATDRQVVIYAHPRKEFSLMHVKWLPELASDLYYEYAAYVTHIKGWGTVGANVTFISLGKQTRVDEFQNILGEFGTFELAGALSYGTRLSNSLSAGISAKVIYSHLSDFGAGAERGGGTATGFAVDLGSIWQTPFRRLTLGAAITNLGPDISYIDANQADPLPRNLAVGFAYRIISTAYNRLTVIGEVNKDLIGITDNLSSQADEAIFNGGMEYQYGSLIALRAGYIYDREGEIKTPTLGFGLQYKNLLFDLAYIPSSDTQVLANTARLAISGRF